MTQVLFGTSRERSEELVNSVKECWPLAFEHEGLSIHEWVALRVY